MLLIVLTSSLPCYKMRKMLSGNNFQITGRVPYPQTQFQHSWTAGRLPVAWGQVCCRQGLVSLWHFASSRTWSPRGAVCLRRDQFAHATVQTTLPSAPCLIHSLGCSVWLQPLGEDWGNDLFPSGSRSRKCTQKSVDIISLFYSPRICKTSFMLSLSLLKREQKFMPFSMCLFWVMTLLGRVICLSFHDKWQWFKLHLCQPLSKWFQVVYLQGLFHLPQSMRQLWGSV